MYNNTFFPKNRAVYDKLWEDVVAPERTQMTI